MMMPLPPTRWDHSACTSQWFMVSLRDRKSWRLTMNLEYRPPSTSRSLTLSWLVKILSLFALALCYRQQEKIVAPPNRLLQVKDLSVGRNSFDGIGIALRLSGMETTMQT